VSAHAIPLATDRKDNATIHTDFSRSRATFICGKRGSGKSYTLGRLIEQVHHTHLHLIIVIDPLSIYWTTALAPSNLQTQTQTQASSFPIRLIVPGDHDHLGILADHLRRLNVELARLWVNPADLSADAWLALFDLHLTEPQGIALYRAVLNTQQTTPKAWSLSQLCAAVEADEHAAAKTKDALLNRLAIAETWGIFTHSPIEAGEGAGVESFFAPNKINIVDVSVLEPGHNSLRNLIVQLITQRLFTTAVANHRIQTLDTFSPPLRGEGPGERSVLRSRPILLCIDEAHNFCPSQSKSLAKPLLIRWAKEGRQLGLSLAVATQQPAALDFELISQCDLFIVHHLTLAEDVKTVARLSTSYAIDMPAFLKGIRKPGEAILVDDLTETLSIGTILPRLLANAFIYLLVYGFTLLITHNSSLSTQYALWCSLFYGSHLVLDMILGGRIGVQLLYPLKWRFWLLNVKSHTEGEAICALLLVVAALTPFLIDPRTVDLNRFLHEQAASPSFAKEDYRNWENQYHVWLDIEGTWQTNHNPIIGRYEVLELMGDTFTLRDPNTGLIFTAGLGSIRDEVYLLKAIAHQGDLRRANAIVPTLSPLSTDVPDGWPQYTTLVTLRITNIISPAAQIKVRPGQPILAGDLVAAFPPPL
jgi:hypothetical protein